MRTFLRDMLMVALLIAATSPAYGRLERHDYRVSAIPRGAQRDYIKAITPLGEVIRQEIFDGDRWRPLASEEGWQLFIEIQHEDNPDALE